MTLSIISFFKNDNAALPLPFSHGMMEMKGKLFSSLTGGKSSKEHSGKGKQFKCFIFSVLFNLAVFLFT